MDARTHENMRATAGFSLTEALVTLAILVMVSTIMATAVPAAYQSYQHIVDASNAHLLLSTTATRLRDELSVADPTTIKTTGLAEGELVRFESLETGFETTLKYGRPSGASHDLLYIEERVKGADAAIDPPRTLIPEKGGAGSGSQLVAKVASSGAVAYDDGVFSIVGLRVTRVGENDTVAGAQVCDADGTPAELSIRVLAGPAS